MRIEALTRHAGVSHNGGPGLVHFRATGGDSRVLRSAWDAVVVRSGLGGPLTLEERATAAIHASAPVFPFLPLPTLAAALQAAYAGRLPAREIADELALAASNARLYDASYGMHLRAAAQRGWVVQPLSLGFFPSVLLGAGRHARILAMNLAATVSAPIALAGINKAIARDLLAAHGLPVPPGGLAASPQAALRMARRLASPVVMKRLIGGNSDGVIVGLSETRDITAAARTLLSTGHAILVEALVPGTELRLHFISGKLHRTYRAEPFTITGDGRQTLSALIAERYPRYLTTMSAARVHQRRLVMCLWGLGVRTMGDVDRIVPADGRVVRISAATGAAMEGVRVTDFVRRGEVTRIERFLGHHGAPSCGLDMIVREPCAPLDDGAVILEINVPCGFSYLDTPARAVAADLDAAIKGDASFRRDRGRVPVWLIMDNEPGPLARRAETILRERYGRVAVGRLDPERSNWLGLLNQPHADALMIHVSEAAIVAHGIPVNLAPMLVLRGDRAEFAQRYPLTQATVRRAKGRLATV